MNNQNSEEKKLIFVSEENAHIFKKFIDENDLFFLDTETTVEDILVFNDLTFIQIAGFSKTYFEKEDRKYLKNTEYFLIGVGDIGNNIKKILKEFLLSKKKQVIIFNACFDLEMLLKFLYPDVFYPGMGLFTYSRDYIKLQVIDLAIILKSVHPGHKKNSLADWGKRIYNFELFEQKKYYQKAFQEINKSSELDEDLTNYLVIDILILILIWAQIKKENYFWYNYFNPTQKIYLIERYLAFEEPLICEVVDSDFRGLAVSPDLFEKTETFVRDVFVTAERIFETETGVPAENIISGSRLKNFIDPENS